jgi:hypothetical protein
VREQFEKSGLLLWKKQSTIEILWIKPAFEIILVPQSKSRPKPVSEMLLFSIDYFAHLLIRSFYVKNFDAQLFFIQIERDDQ